MCQGTLKYSVKLQGFSIVAYRRTKSRFLYTIELFYYLFKSPGGDEIFCIRLDRPCNPPNLLYNGYQVIPGGKEGATWWWPPTTI
jgi:hypothetical protein